MTRHEVVWTIGFALLAGAVAYGLSASQPHAHAEAEEHRRFYMEHTEKIGNNQFVFVLRDLQEQRCTLTIVMTASNGSAALTSQPVACDR